MSESVRLNGDSPRHRRAALAEFLRSRRARLTPEAVGLPANGRRRTPGLRREEVALLANVGVSWCTSLEQGRDMNPSDAVLEGIAAALRLPPEDEWDLFVLADRCPPACVPPPTEAVSPALKHIVDDLRTSPAFAIDPLGELAYWNQPAEAVFDLATGVPPHERNLVWKLFADPASRDRYASWESTARAFLARFRAEFARHSSDPRFAILRDNLERQSAKVRQWWSGYEVAGDGDGRVEVVHSDVGLLVLEHTTLSPPSDPDLRLMLYAPASDSDSVKLDRLRLGATGALTATPRAGRGRGR